MTVRLLQFPYSHYNEKARWALDYKGIGHRRENMLPGVHKRRLRRLTGLSQTPVMLYNDEVVPGSQNIILRLEHKFPDTRRLLPACAAERSEALALSGSLDEVVGPAVFALEVAAFAEQAEYVQGLYVDDKPTWVRVAYRSLFPIATRHWFAAATAECDAATEQAQNQLLKTMDRIANRINGRGYLVGSQFSVADLTAAALLAPLVNPPHPDMRKPEPVPDRVRELQATMAAHQIAPWVLQMYAKHRPQPTSQTAPAGTES